MPAMPEDIINRTEHLNIGGLSMCPRYRAFKCVLQIDWFLCVEIAKGPMYIDLKRIGVISWVITKLVGGKRVFVISVTIARALHDLVKV